MNNMEFNKITTRITNNPTIEYTVHLQNVEAASYDLQQIKLHFTKNFLHGVNVRIRTNTAQLGNVYLRTKEEVNNFWQICDLEKVDEHLKNKNIFGEFDSIAIEKILSLGVLAMLITTHFPTNWLILLPDK